MKLGATEKHLKTYEYFKGIRGRQGSMVVTDRRIVHILRDRRTERHSEVRIEDIRAIETGYQKFFLNPGGLVMMIIGLLMLVASIVVAVVLGLTNIFLAIGCAAGALVGFLLLLIGLLVFLHKKQKITMIITADCRPGVLMDVYAANRHIEKPLDLKPRRRRMRIRIDETTARTMIDEISAMVWELQSGEYDAENLVAEVDVRVPVPPKMTKEEKKAAKAAEKAEKAEKKAQKKGRKDEATEAAEAPEETVEAPAEEVVEAPAEEAVETAEAAEPAEETVEAPAEA